MTLGSHLWAALAAIYLVVGAMELMSPTARPAQNPSMARITEEYSEPSIKIGHVLTPVAAVGLALLHLAPRCFTAGAVNTRSRRQRRLVNRIKS